MFFSPYYVQREFPCSLFEPHCLVHPQLLSLLSGTWFVFAVAKLRTQQLSAFVFISRFFRHSFWTPNRPSAAPPEKYQPYHRRILMHILASSWQVLFYNLLLGCNLWPKGKSGRDNRKMEQLWDHRLSFVSISLKNVPGYNRREFMFLLLINPGSLSCVQMIFLLWTKYCS